MASVGIGSGAAVNGKASVSSNHAMNNTSSPRNHIRSTNGARTPRQLALTSGTTNADTTSKIDSPMFRERVVTLMHQGDNFSKKLDLEKRRGMELDTCLLNLRELHLETKKKYFRSIHGTAGTGSGSTHGIPSTSGGARSQVLPVTTAANEIKAFRTLENRLEKILTRYNEVCNTNKKLREEIQFLRREKVQQQHFHEKLDRETHLKQNEISTLTSSIQNAFDVRDRINRQSEALKKQAANEDVEFEAGWMDQIQELKHDRANMKETPRLRPSKGNKSPMGRFNDTKSLSIPDNGLSTGGGINSGTVKGRTSNFRLPSGENTVTHQWLLNEKEFDLKKQMERVKFLEDALMKIKKKTNVFDVEELSNAFFTADEKNFSLFNMINELNTEMEALEIENNIFEQLVEECKGSDVNSDSYRRKLKQHLEDQIEKSKQKVTYFEMRHAETAEAMEAMKTGAMNIFHRVGYKDETFTQELLSSGNIITEINMMKLLGVIEQRVGELVDIHNIATNAPTFHAGHGGYGIREGGYRSDSQDTTSTSHNGVKHPSGKSDNKKGNNNLVGNGTFGLRPTLPSADDFGDSDNEDNGSTTNTSGSPGTGNTGQDDTVRPCKISEIQEKTAAIVGRRKEKQIRTTKQR